MATTKVSLKLFIDKKGRRVLFAEADKEFVDFLYSIFTLPVGAVTSLLKEGGGMVGSLPSLYQTFENLSETRIFQPDKNKRFLLEPMVFMPGAKVPLLLPNVGSTTTFRQFYRCSANSYVGCRNYVADDNSTVCPQCKSKMNCLVTFLEPTSAIGESSTSEEDYVKRTATYMVMDDMEVKPLSSTTLIPLLTKFNDTNDIEEKVVDVGMDEGVKLLQASFQSKTVLTDDFLPAEITKTDEESIIKSRDLPDQIGGPIWIEI
ncbi:uncharacterized protein LOC133864266 [Alnus glutinosa]|uniref:uncharacterized protein LOC133864266 n=1 Tax=Alnus glutinosa TaxID=3517 RepID=UPI002D776012|nr:uncharacterized protein LOC133864266 [Alnus glutinosa]